MNPELLPQSAPNFMEELVRLAPVETSSREHIAATLDYIEDRMDKWKAEEERRLRKAEKRIGLCSFLHTFLAGVGLSHTRAHSQHFDWCPFEDWMGKDFGNLSQMKD